MRHIVINALNLRPGGGLQVIAGLLSCVSAGCRYTVLWSDPKAYDVLRDAAGNRSTIAFARPVSSDGSLSVFIWQMTRLGGWLARNGAHAILNVNHHFPGASVPQVVYHLNVLRFERPKGRIFSFSEWSDRLRDARARTALSAADANVFESRFLMRLAQAQVRAIRNPSVRYIGLKDRHAPPPQATSRLPPHILVMTSPQPHKDNGLLLDILALLNTMRPDVPWRMRIAGGRTPEAFSGLRARAETMQLGGQVDWLGFQSHDELARIGSDCLCLVSTSRVESFCMVALEAMSWGCPAIVANATAMPESIGDAGLLAEPGNAADFAEKVLSLHQNTALREGLVIRGAQHAATNNWSAAAAHFDRIFAELTADAQLAP